MPIKKRDTKSFILDMKGISIIDVTDGDYIIIINKETGLWKIVHNSYRNIILALCEKPLSFEDLKKMYPKNMDLLNMLFKNSLLKINGKSLIKEDLYDKSNNHIQLSYPSYIVVKYTRKCNLACSYCYATSEDKEYFSMSNDMIVYIMKKMKDIYGDQKFILCLHGGEPILRYKDISSLTKELSKISNNITISIQSNATLITKDIAELLKKEKIRVGISIDGFDKETNSQRCYSDGKSSIIRVHRGLDNLLSVGVIPGILCVINSFNQYKILEYFDYYINKGIKKFGFNLFFPAGEGRNIEYEIDIDNLISTNLELIKKINAYNSKIQNSQEYISERGITTLVNNLLNKKRYNMCSVSPCGAGKLTLAFDTDGSIYPCDDFITQKKFSYGNILTTDNLNDAIQNNHITQILTAHNVNNIKECSVCNWKKICTLHCPSDAYFHNKGLFCKPHSMCIYMKGIIPEIIDLLHNNLIDPRNFILC
jgi:radical SAM additional 4Fe4S-binding domain